LFADFFQSVYVKDDDPIISYTPDCAGNLQKVSLILFAENAVFEAIMDFDEQKGSEPEGITPSILKKLVSVVQAPLAFLFNLSLSSGVFSVVWKESFIFIGPIFKNGDKRDISCYRGISILSKIPKMFEKMVCDKLTGSHQL
jgi:hypothetical protein